MQNWKAVYRKFCVHILIAVVILFLIEVWLIAASWIPSTHPDYSGPEYDYDCPTVGCIE